MITLNQKIYLVLEELSKRPRYRADLKEILDTLKIPHVKGEASDLLMHLGRQGLADISERNKREFIIILTPLGQDFLEERRSKYRATENPVRQSNQPTIKPSKKADQEKSIWSKPPTLGWQIIAVIVVIALAVIKLLFNISF